MYIYLREAFPADWLSVWLDVRTVFRWERLRRLRLRLRDLPAC